MKSFLGRNSQILAFIILALMTALALNAVVNKGNTAIYEAQLSACKRANLIITESNRRIIAHEADTEVLRQFMQGAEKARFATYDQSHHRSDLEAARTYGNLIQMLDKKVHFDAIPLVNCGKTVPKP